MPKIAILYDDDAYVEKLDRSSKPIAGRAAGLMGRQVAGKEFLDAYLTHGSWTELVALVRNQASRESLIRLCGAHPSAQAKQRRLQFVEERNFQDAFFPQPPAGLFYTPAPPDPKYAWGRSHAGPGAFALCGVTHTLCSEVAMQSLCSLITAPFESYDALICTSQSVAQMVRSVTGAYADYLSARHGGSPKPRVRLVTIPLGVNVEKFHPASPEERARQRQAFKIADDEFVILFVGRLSHHAKAHPFPMFRGAAEAARTAGRKVHLILAGWAANQQVTQAFIDGARLFAPHVRLTVIDGTSPRVRFAIWQAADVFTSLSDNIQETFGLVIIEAMACGLPVVASDWDGYRDLVVHGETGYLVPTTMVRDAAAAATARLLMGEVNYDHFLAECSQTVAVDPAATCEAYARLINDPDLRTRMGAAGRDRACRYFAWQHVIRAYEDLWCEQEDERLRAVSRQDPSPPCPQPASYPPIDFTFAGYPTTMLDEADRLESVARGEDLVRSLIAMPLINHEAHRRTSDAKLLSELLSACSTPQSIADLDSLWRRAGISYATGRATVAWMLKYGLLRSTR